MKKTLRFSFLFILALLWGGGHAYADEAVFDWSNVTVTNVDIADGHNYTDGQITIAFFKNEGSNVPAPNKEGSIRVYKGSKITVSATNGYVITSMKFTATGSSYGADKLTYNETSISNDWILNTPVQAIDLIGTAACRFKTIVVTYQKSDVPVKESANLAFNVDVVNVVLGENFTQPILTKSTTADVTYSSNNEDVAIVDAATGEVTLKGEGKAIITAKAEENDLYSAGSASYTLNVTAPVLTEVSVPYTESFATGLGSFTINNAVLPEGVSYVWSHDATNKYMKASAYVNGKNIATESWLVSPTINLIGIENAEFTFNQCLGWTFFGDKTKEATLWIQEEGGEWEQIEIAYPADVNGKNWTAWEEQTISLAAYNGKKIKVGFKYISTDEKAGTWELKGISVTGVVTAISSLTVSTIDTNAPIYNLAGQRVSKDTKGILIQNGKKFVNNK